LRAASSAQEPSRRPAVHRHGRRHDAAHEHGLAARREAVLRERAEGAEARAGRVVARRDGRWGLDGRFEVLQGPVRWNQLVLSLIVVAEEARGEGRTVCLPSRYTSSSVSSHDPSASRRW